MKLAILADVHENILALKMALADAKKNNVDKYIFLGDYITDGDNSNDTLDLVKKNADYAILGNREKYILNFNAETKNDNYKNNPISYTYNSLSKNNINYIKTLKNTITIEIENNKILIIHGDVNYTGEITDFYEKVIANYSDFDICLFGHSHIYSNAIYKGKRFINPGSVGMPTDYPTYKYCILDIDDSIKVKLREFETAISYKKMEKLYKDTQYYKENPIWGNLILQTIKDGKNYCAEFVDLLNLELPSEKSLTFEQYSKICEETYNKLQKENIQKTR